MYISVRNHRKKGEMILKSIYVNPGVMAGVNFKKYVWHSAGCTKNIRLN